VSASTTNVKQLEYELTDARYQIERLQKQLEANATKDDRAALEGQVNFLNDVIVELRNTNEQLKTDIEFLKNPFLADDPYSQTASARASKSAPRLYCKLNASSSALLSPRLLYLSR
jgi:predicted  nucleic acid-binding Zn-ribbon protein